MTTWTPHAYQLKAAQHVLSNSGAALFLEPGLGKTAIVMACLTILKRDRAMRGALVVCPLTPMYNTWPAEAKKWDEFRGLSLGTLHGTKKAAVLREQHDVYLINPEGLVWLAEELKGFKQWPFDVLVVDESYKFKDGRTKRFATIKTMLLDFKRRVILNGTPAPNGLMDLWGQQYIVDRGHALGQYVTHFRRKFFEEIVYRTHSEWVPMPGSKAAITDKLKPTSVFMSSEDYLQLPELNISTRSVALPEKVMKVYRKLERDYVVAIGNSKASAPHAAAAQMKLRQVTGGHLYTEDGAATVDTTKLDALVGLIEERAGQPTMVICNFQHEAEDIQRRLKKEFGLDVPYLAGGVTPAQRIKLQNEWNNNRLPVLLVHPTTGSLGLNLQAGGDTMIWYTLTWSLIEWDQMIRRIWRQGQEKRVFVIVLTATGTVDEKVAAALSDKNANQQSINQALKGD